MIGDDGQPETEIVEMVIPRFRITTVFDVSQTEAQRPQADDNNNTECHANPCSNGRDKTVQADKKMPYCRAHRHSRLAGAAGGFLDSKLHLTGTSLHLCLGCYAPHSFICGGSQLALTLGHTANIARHGLGGDGFFLLLAGGANPPHGASAALHRSACRAQPVSG